MEEEKKVEETKEVKPTYKKHGPLYWLIIVVGMTFIVFMSVRLGMKISEDKIEKEDGGKPSVTSNSNSNKPEEKKEVTEETKKELYTKLALLFSDEKKNYGETIVGGTGDDYSFVFKNNLSEETKSFIIIRTIDTKPVQQVDKTKVKFQDAEADKSFHEEGATGEYSVYDTTAFANNYKKVFGTEPTYVDIKGCPSFYYDLNSKKYIEFMACGFVAVKQVFVYPEEYIADGDDTIKVVAYAGKSITVEEEAYYYKDVDNEEGSASTTSKFTTIDASNKDNFTKYNFIFKKASDGNYYYDSVVKAN